LSFRPLSPKEIRALGARGCYSEDWSALEVSPDFDPGRLKNSGFFGPVKIGSLRGEAVFPGGFTAPCGIENAVIRNCTIGDGVYIRNIHSYLANYDIAPGVILDDVQRLFVDGESSFGNGVRVKAANESGGREIPIYDHLSCHIAYLLCFYRHDLKLLSSLESMIAAYAGSVRSRRGSIGRGARIMNCGILENLRIGESAVLEGVSLLSNGTILSKPGAPSYVGPKVIARDFIFSTGAVVTDNVIISRCFLGQAAELARLYSASDSVFFANCTGYNGEACSVFAGPYTVSHHKSTLLIAGLFSFVNAGSGSNQSNHMYKLGPVHQGIVERGSKTASDSYMMWPMRVGAFSLITGRHTSNSDTRDFPFSYLTEVSGETVLVPGINLKSVGTLRDAKKWPLRDKRRDPEINDFLTYNLLTPYTASRMIRGMKILHSLKVTSGYSSMSYYYNGVKIERSGLEKGLVLYQMGLTRYLGNLVVNILRSAPLRGLPEIQGRFAPAPGGWEDWLDLAGLYLPCQKAEVFFEEIRCGKLACPEAIRGELENFHRRFGEYEMAWAGEIIKQRTGKAPGEFDCRDFIRLIREWIEAVEELDLLRIKDGEKEFSPIARSSYGIDGGEPERNADFAQVRGDSGENDIIRLIRERLDLKKKSARELTAQLENLAAGE
jgi:hypothetical protein